MNKLFQLLDYFMCLYVVTSTNTVTYMYYALYAVTYLGYIYTYITYIYNIYVYCYICTSFISIDLESTVVDLDPKSQEAKNSSKSQPPFLCFSGFWMPSTYGIISRF